MNGYDLSRQWWDFAYNSGHNVKPEHHAVYLYAVELCNRLGWKQKFAIPTTMTMEAVGIRSYKTYINVFRDLCEWGVIELHEKSSNQYSANVIALVIFTEAQSKALDKAILNHLPEQVQSNDQSSDSIIKQQTTNNKPQTKKAPKIFVPPTLQEVVDFFVSEKFPKELGEHVFKYYADNDWKDSEDKGFSSWKQKMRGNWMKERNRNWNEFMAKEQVRTPKYQTYNPDIHK